VDFRYHHVCRACNTDKVIPFPSKLSDGGIHQGGRPAMSSAAVKHSLTTRKPKGKNGRQNRKRGAALRDRRSSSEVSGWSAIHSGSMVFDLYYVLHVEVLTYSL